MDAPAPTAGEIVESQKKLSRTWKVVAILTIVFASIALLVPIGYMAFIYIAVSIEANHLVQTADAGFSKAKQTIDPQKLRDWATKESAQHAISYLTDGQWKIPESEYPSYLRDLYADPIEDAYIEKHGNQSYVQIYWGGPLFHWMLYIGDTNFAVTDDPRVQTAKWVPGIYYGREDTVHPIQ